MSIEEAPSPPGALTIKEKHPASFSFAPKSGGYQGDTQIIVLEAHV